MKKTIKTIAVVLLIGVSVFFAVVYYKTFLKNEVKAEEENNVENMQTTLSPSKDNEPEQTETIKPVFRSEFPKKATRLTDGFINNVGGYRAEELKEYYYFSNKYYLIFSSTSDDCDITDNGSGICVAVIDSSGSLSGVTSLSSDKREKYLCSSIYDDGILIVTSSGNSTYVYGVKVDGEITKLSLPSESQNAIDLYCSVGTVIVTTDGQNIRVYAISSNLGVKYNIEFENERVIDLLALYQSGNFTLFANGESYGKMITFDLKGNHSSTNLGLISDVLPSAEGYLLAIERSNVIDLVRYSYGGEALGQFELASGDKCKLARSPNGYYAVCYGTNVQTSSYFLCKHFETVSENKNDYLGFTDVGESVYYNGHIYFMAVNRKNSSVYAYDVNTHTAKNIASIENAYGLRFNVEDGGLTLTFTSTNTVGDFKSCWGETDVWIKRIE